MAKRTAQKADAPPPRRRPLLYAIPLLIVLALAGLFYEMLASGNDPSKVPSALIGRPAPQFTLAPLDGLTRDGAPVPGFSSGDLKGGVSVVNVWASWCAPCRAEHPVLMALAGDDGVTLYGLNYKDKAENARRFLGQLGNPFAAVGVDESGRTAIDWGVYGVPETFIVDADGIIRHKHVGPLDDQGLERLRGVIAASRKPAG